MTNEAKANLVKQYGKDPKNTGSAAVQVALLTERINELKPHFERHKHDYSSNRGLLKMIGRRKSLLKYVQKKDENEYQELIKALGLRK